MSQELANWAQVLTAVVALGALLFAVVQLRAVAGIQREATTSVKIRDYLILALQNPDFANPSLHNVDYDGFSFDGDRLRFERYEWFVAVMLNICAEVAKTNIEPDWERTILNQLSMHKKYFLSDNWKSTYRDDDWNPRMRSLLKKTMNEDPRPPTKQDT